MSARYEISVKGRVCRELVCDLGRLDIDERPGDTVRSGELDQAQLRGLLRKLRDRGLELSEIQNLDLAPE